MELHKNRLTGGSRALPELMDYQARRKHPVAVRSAVLEDKSWRKCPDFFQKHVPMASLSLCYVCLDMYLCVHTCVTCFTTHVCTHTYISKHTEVPKHFFQRDSSPFHTLVLLKHA